MDATEYLYCIKKLNPQASVVIWTNPDGTLTPAWDDSHVGIKPNEDDCQAVLTEVQSELTAIQPPDPLSDLITTLINNGTLPTDNLPDSIASMASVKTTLAAKAALKKAG
jgi:hypothetical protein